MTHHVAPLDAYDDSFWCTCGNTFRSSSGWAICPKAIVKGSVKFFNSQWFYFVKADGAVLYRGNTDTWREAYDRAYRHVAAIRPIPPLPAWPNHSASSTIKGLTNG